MTTPPSFKHFISILILGILGICWTPLFSANINLLPNLQPVFNGVVRSIALQKDGKILVGGDFDKATNAPPYSYVYRFNPSTGTADNTFDAFSNGSVTHVAVQDDGLILVAGAFTFIGGAPVQHLARLNPNGSFAPGFNFNPQGPITALLVKPDGKILVAGSATSGPNTVYWLKQLTTQGFVDGSFSTSINGPVHALALGSDGNILLGGAFTMVGSSSRLNLAQLTPAGQVDNFFNVSVNAKVSSLNVQTNGSILLAGDFTQIGALTRNRLGRISSTGVPDSTFQAGISLDGPVESVALQANGNILIAGSFTTKAALLGTQGALVSGYNLPSVSSISALALEADGRLLLSGLGSGSDYYLLRAPESTTSSQSLSPTSPNRVVWSRTGALPELDAAQLELWNGSIWTPLGSMNRISGGWEKNGLSLPQGSWLRSRGSYGSGQSNDSRSSHEIVSVFGDAPDIAVEYPVGTPLAQSGSTLSFASQEWLTIGEEKIITIKNTGTGVLTNLAVSVISGHLGDFVLLPPATNSLAAGESTAFRLIFQPRGGGLRQAALRIQSSDYDESTFDVTLQGLGIHQDATYLPSFNNYVSAFSLLPDGTVLAGGRFTQVNGQNRNYLAKIKPDGTLDSAFTPDINNQITSVQVQRDRKILIRGYFTTVNGTPRNAIARLHPNGELDSGFTPAAIPSGYPGVELLPDGKILMVTSFTDPGGSPHSRVVRLLEDGSLDAAFNSEAATSGNYDNFQNLAVQDDGKIIIIGDFGLINGTYRRGVARLLSDGTLDNTFIPPPISSATSVGIQADGKILIAGQVKIVNFAGTYAIRRLLSDGSDDPSFNASRYYGEIVGLQTDGKIWVAGMGTSVGGFPGSGILRLLPDGTEDDSLDIDADSPVLCFANAPDGKIVTGGWFTSIGGVNRSRLARLPNNIAATQSLATSSPSEIEWSRSGSSPEINQVVFEKWNGSVWNSLGAASRTATGWNLSGLSLGTTGYLRARGTARLASSGSLSHVEQIISYNFTGVALTPLQQWRLEQFGTHENTGNAANHQDFDTDGVANLLEYVQGSAPNDSSSASLPVIAWELSGETEVLTMSVSKAQGIASLTYIPEASDDLTTWYGDAAHVTVIENSATLLKFRLTNPGSKGFLRLRVVEP